MSIKVFLEKYDEKIADPPLGVVEYVRELIERGGEYSLEEIKAVEGEDHYIICICGGNNGSPDWLGYFASLAALVWAFKQEGWKAWLIELRNNCLNDVHTAYFGIREIKKGKE